MVDLSALLKRFESEKYTEKNMGGGIQSPRIPSLGFSENASASGAGTRSFENILSRFHHLRGLSAPQGLLGGQN